MNRIAAFLGGIAVAVGLHLGLGTMEPKPKYETPSCFLHQSGMAVAILIDTAKGKYIGQLRQPRGASVIYLEYAEAEREFEAGFNQVNCETGEPLAEEGAEGATGATGGTDEETDDESSDSESADE